MKNRLQFRHCTRVFNSKEEIKNHIAGLFNNDESPLKPAIAAEPLVLYYQESGSTEVNAVLAIGRPKSSDEYFLIDVAGIQRDLDILTDEVFNLSELSDKLDKEIEDRISGDTRLEEMIAAVGEGFEDILKRICQSAGFNDDGDDMGKYDDIAHDSTHYIVSANSLANADILLDEAIWQNHVELVHAIASARTDLKVSVVNVASARTMVSYDIMQGDEKVGTIEIPTDRTISRGELIKNDSNKWVIRFYVVNENGTEIGSFDVDVNNLEDIYTGGDNVSVNGNVISVSFSGLTSEVSAEKNGISVQLRQVNGLNDRIVLDAPDFNAIAASALTDAKAYTDEKAEDTLDQAKEYADSISTTIYKVKGSKEYFADLAEVENPQVGDVWNVENEYRYSGNTGEIKIYPAGTNYVYVKDQYAAVGRWDPLGGQAVDMSLYLTKEEFMSYSTASTEALNAKIEDVKDDLRELSASTVSEVARLDEKIDEIAYTGDSYIDVDNRDRVINLSGHVITRLQDLDDVASAGTYFVDAFLVKQMKADLEQLIAESVNEDKVKKIVAEMLIGTDKEIAVSMLNSGGTVTTASTEADKVQIGFADDAYFEADLPDDMSH